MLRFWGVLAVVVATLMLPSVSLGQTGDQKLPKDATIWPSKVTTCYVKPPEYGEERYDLRYCVVVVWEWKAEHISRVTGVLGGVTRGIKSAYWVVPSAAPPHLPAPRRVQKDQEPLAAEGCFVAVREGESMAQPVAEGCNTSEVVGYLWIMRHTYDAVGLPYTGPNKNDQVGYAPEYQKTALQIAKENAKRDELLDASKRHRQDIERNKKDDGPPSLATSSSSAASPIDSEPQAKPAKAEDDGEERRWKADRSFGILAFIISSILAVVGLWYARKQAIAAHRNGGGE